MKFEPDRRAGALTPYLLASLAYTSESSPIHRGVFVGRACSAFRSARRSMPSRPPRRPAPEPDDARERSPYRPSPQRLRDCHSVMNPLGYALEHFDAVGRYREKDGAKPVDSTGNYETRNGETEKFAGAGTGTVPGRKSRGPCARDQMFHHLVKQSVRAYGVNRPEAPEIVLGKRL